MWQQSTPLSQEDHVARRGGHAERRCQDRKTALSHPSLPETRHATKRKKQASQVISQLFLSWKNLGHLVVAYWYTGTACLDVITRHCPPLLPLTQPGSITFPPIWIQIRTIYYTSFQYHPSQWRGHNPRRRACSSKQDTTTSGEPGSLAILSRP